MAPRRQSTDAPQPRRAPAKQRSRPTADQALATVEAVTPLEDQPRDDSVRDLTLPTLDEVQTAAIGQTV